MRSLRPLAVASPTVKKMLSLWGHSMGGMVITEAGERYANNISRLVYLAAFIEPPKDETSAPRTPVKIADALRSALVVSEDRISTTVKDEALCDVFYGDCSDADIELAPFASGAGKTPSHGGTFNSHERAMGWDQARLYCLPARRRDWRRRSAKNGGRNKVPRDP